VIFSFPEIILQPLLNLRFAGIKVPMKMVMGKRGLGGAIN